MGAVLAMILTRIIAVCSALLVMAGCTGLPKEFEGVSALLTGQSTDVSQRYLQLTQANTPLLRFGVLSRNSSAFLRLDVTRAGVKNWLSPEGISISTRDGLLIATRGLGGDLLASDVGETQAMIAAGNIGITTRFHTFISGADEAVTRTYVCELALHGTQTITISTQQIATRVLIENCQSLDQEFSNLYWVVGAENLIIQSQQWAGPTTQMLLMQVQP